MADDMTPGEADARRGEDDDLDALEPRLAALLADPAVWERPERSSEDDVVAAITAARLEEHRIDAEALPAAVTRLRRSTRWFTPVVAGAAAVVLLVAGALIIGAFDDPDEGVLVALEGTDEAPGATAEADIADTPAGTRIIIAVEDLPPAPEGTYYEAWLRQSPEIGVSAGTFHLRGGDAEIELWAGVSLDDYPIVTVTLQEEGGGAASSGVVVLRGDSG